MVEEDSTGTDPNEERTRRPESVGLVTGEVLDGRTPAPPSSRYRTITIWDYTPGHPVALRNHPFHQRPDPLPNPLGRRVVRAPDRQQHAHDLGRT